MKPRFKIYFHKHFYHQGELPLKKKNGGGFWCLIKKTVKVLVFGLYGLCYLVGRGLLVGGFNMLRWLLKQLVDTKEAIAARAKLAFSKNFFVSNFSLVLGALLLVGLLSGFKLFVKADYLKQNVLKIFGQGQMDFKQAQSLLRAQSPDAALIELSQAHKNFQSAQNQITEAERELRLLIALLPQGEDGQRIIHASSLMTESGADFLAFYEQIKNLKFTAEGISSAQESREIILKSSELLLGASKKLRQADAELNEVSISSVPLNQRSEFLQVKGLLNKGVETLGSLSEVYEIFAKTALNSHHILFVFENNNELRPGGGFIGSYASVRQQGGKISQTRLGSIYDLDGQLKEMILPPQPILAVNERWFLRDSNWFANFPDSAKKISEFYEKTGGETPDMIVAITPSFVEDLLKITGEVPMPAYKTVLTNENFIETTQVLTTMSGITPENKPKQFLADLMPVLLQRLGEVKFENFDALIQTIFDNLSEKQIVFYSRDPETQTILNKFNWTGEIKQTEGDYLQVVSANLGGTKSDVFLAQTLSLETQKKESKLINELELTFTNNLPDLEHTENTRFVRVMVPKNSKLLSASGFDYKNLESPNADNFKEDPQGRAWDKSAVRDLVTGTLIGEEAGKTFFGNWLTTRGGQTRTVKLVYELPFDFPDFGAYSLMLQKQVGAQPFKAEYTLNLGANHVVWKSFSESMLPDNSFRLKAELNSDKYWGLVINN